MTRLEHSLQTATRAQDDGADVEMVVAALIHDIGDELAPDNHSQLAAAIIRPYVRAEVTWTVAMHGLFQLRYYGHHLGPRSGRQRCHIDHPWYDTCDRFCARWDQASFDPAYPTLPLEAFEPARARGLHPARPSTPPSSASAVREPCRSRRSGPLPDFSCWCPRAPSRRSALAASAVASTAARSTTVAR